MEDSDTRSGKDNTRKTGLQLLEKAVETANFEAKQRGAGFSLARADNGQQEGVSR